jgi:hypothetical protein
MSVCSQDSEVQRKAEASQVRPGSGFPNYRDVMPRNVRIINETLNGDVQNELSALVGYNDFDNRENMLNLFSWFPSFCNEKPTNHLQSFKEVCKQELMYLNLFGLLSEPTLKEF